MKAAEHKNHTNSTTIIDLIEGWRNDNPSALAMVIREKDTRIEISRKQLGESVNKLAMKLEDMCPPGGLVVIMDQLNRPTAGTVVALLACLRSNRAFALCTRAHMSSVFKQTGGATGTTVVIATGSDQAAHRSWDACDVQVVDSDHHNTIPTGSIANYVVFSSGTTGEPKGIIGSSVGLHAFIHWQVGTFGINEADRCACLTPPTFDVFLRDALTPLAGGATLVLPSEEDLSDPAGLLLAEEITACHVVPSLAMRWLRRTHRSSATLRLVFFAGEPLFRQHLRALRAFAPHARAINLYGPSETTLAKFFFDATGWEGDGVCPVGNPIPGTQFSLHDGEVCISPDFPLGGYLGREDAAFYHQGGRCWFATGDLGVNTNSGLVIEGRTDQQVKVTGVRVNMTEVAAALADCAGVDNATVLATQDELGTHLAAFAQSTTRTSPELLGELVELLPTTHLPAQLLVLAELPLNSRGKVDRAALRKILSRNANRAHTEDAEESPILHQICASATQSLGTEVRPDDDFFAAGGTSLEAAMWAKKLADSQIEVSLRSLFELRTPRALAAFAETKLSASTANSQGGPSSVEGPTVEFQNFSGALPMTARQRRYARVYLPKGNRNWANMTTAVRLPEELLEDSEAALRVATETIRTLVSRHDSLRSSIDSTQGMQYFRSAQECVLPPLKHLSNVEWERQLGEPIPVEQYPPHRWALVDGHLRWVIHHLFCDGHSQSVLRKEATDLLRGEVLGENSALSYAEFTTREPRPASLAWWEKQLAEPPELPILMESTREETGAWRAVRPIPSELLQASRASGITPFQGVMLGMFGVLMERTGRKDFLIGTPGLGRTVSGVEDTVGNFISLVLIRLRADEVTPAVLQDRLLGALENQDYQYDQIMDDLGQDTSEDRFPITGFFASHMDVDSPPALGVSPMEVDVKFDAMAYVLRCGSSYFLEVQARRSIFSEQEMDNLLSDLLSHWNGQC